MSGLKFNQSLLEISGGDYEVGRRYEILASGSGKALSDDLYILDRWVGGFCLDLGGKINGSGFGLSLPSLRWLAYYDSTWFLFKHPETNQSIVKRYTQYLWDKVGLKLGNDFISQFGSEAARAYNMQESKIYFDFVDGSCHDWDWHPGRFGEYRDSCMWGGYDAGRVELFESGLGGAIRLYNGMDEAESDGIGRAFAFVWGPGMCFFNLYGPNGGGDDRLETLLRSVFQNQDLRYRDLGIHWEGGYLNTGRVVEVLPAGAESAGVVYLDWGGVFCVACGDRVNLDDAYRPDGHEGYLCEYCYCDRFTGCEWCNDDVSFDDVVVMDNGDNLCPYCFERKGFFCSDCGEAFYNESGRAVVGGRYCKECFDAFCGQCESCGDYHERKRLDSDGFCADCATLEVIE